MAVCFTSLFAFIIVVVLLKKMGTSYRVAVLGSQEYRYGLQVFDLTVDQICSLLEKPDPKGKGIDHEMLGAQPGLTYQVMGGGRFFPSVSRKKVAETMKGVEILIAMIPTQPHFFDQIHGRKFYSSLIEDNLMDKCSMVVARIVDNYEASGHGDKPDTDPMTIMEKQNIDLTKFKEKLRIISDPESEGVSQDLTQLRAALLGDELRERVIQPVKETLSAGKILLGAGQRLSGWIESLIKTSPAA